MKPAPFDYYAPASVEEACQLLADAGGGATVLAGGQTLMPLLALRMSQPFVLVDITRIRALRGVSRSGATTRIGPVTRQNEALADATLQQHQPLLVTALRHVGHHQTRNRGTVGGSIALGEPAAELPATAVALGASVEVRSVRGTRTIPAQELYFGPYATALEPDELLTAVDVPEWPAGTVSLFREIAMRPGDFALVGLTGALTVADGVVTRAGVAWFGMGPTPIKARQLEAALVGQRVDALDAGALTELAIADTAPFDDLHATAEYRRTVGRRVFAAALGEALNLRKAA
ncbi:FAD binding domain-containing protein [Sinimarinibacterium flocculans]|uniref:Carbon-monoxide dehydrogenase medium subunit n=1 Tax=Sinimarinibacterium flocculans TaxID=985250 RepID=A0A318EDQ0_9GAMM|nr:xanthine dehydrogenase family protein subunit M [Sinimarinibacterium flocculans]PXV68360.1 carbon-monoxide dehydrogenase medium subunit [Sinimarinibacterium flocculans]